MSLIRLAFAMLLRHLRSGETGLAAAALVLAVAAITSVGFLGDRLSRALELEANQILGGDLLLVSDHPWASAFREEAGRLGLKSAATAVLPSMAARGERMQLARVEAVEPAYPLRGRFRIAPGAGQPDRAAPSGPGTGEVWLDERLAAALGARPGDQVGLGDARFRVVAILRFDAETGASFLSFMPRLVMNLSDLPATGLVRPGSRVNWRLHFAGGAGEVATFESWARPRLERGQRLEDVAQARPALRSSLDRAQRYLSLSALLAVLLAAVALALAARRFMVRNLAAGAVMRCMGARRRQLLSLSLLEFGFLALGAALPGCLLGAGVQAALAQLLSGFVALDLPPPSWRPAAEGLAVALVLVAGFALPPLVALGRVSPLAAVRREFVSVGRLGVGMWLAALLALFSLMAWIARDGQLALVLCLGLAGALVLYILLARALVALAVRQAGRFAPGSGLGLGLGALRRRALAGSLQAVALALGFAALLLLALVKGDLISAWRESLPPDAPNRFLINIQPGERQGLTAFFQREGLPVPDLLPMVRGRLVEVNQRAVRPETLEDGRARRLAEREFNLSWAVVLPPGNEVVAGHWRADGPGGFSVEEGLARTLGLQLGDEIAFDVAGSRLAGRISNLRKLRWESMRVNFFVIAPPGLLESYPASYIASFRLSPEQAEIGGRLSRAFPELTLIDVSAVLDQLQSMAEQLGRAVQLVFLFSLVGGVLVLMAALDASLEERASEYALLAALGARGRQLRGALLAEFAILGGLAGLLAAVGGSALAWALARFVFHLDYVPDPAWPLVVVFAATGLSLLAGLRGFARIRRRPPMAVLRAGE